MHRFFSRARCAARRPLRQPLLHFLTLGALLYVLAPARAPVSTFARPSGPRAERSLASPAVPTAGASSPLASDPDPPSADDTLYTLGLELGLDRFDPVVRRRLVQNARFLADDPQRSDAQLYRDALALGMDRTDPVVRRRVIALARLRLEGAGRGAEPSDAELEAYLDQHAAEFGQPARVRISQIYLSRDRRGERLETDAHDLLARLEAERRVPSDTLEWGDPGLAPRDLPLQAARQLERVFGPASAEAVTALEPGAWAGPIASPSGVHLVWVHERRPARIPTLAEVRNQVRDALLAARDAQAVARALVDGGAP